RQRFDKGNARLEQGGHLASDHGDVERTDPLEHALEIDLAALARACYRLVEDVGDEDALLLEENPQRLCVLRVANALDRLAGGADAFPFEYRHGRYSTSPACVAARTSSALVIPRRTFCAPSSRSV